MATSLSHVRVRAAAPDGGVPHSYLVFADGRLWRVGTGSTRAELVAEVPGIREVGEGTGDGRLKGKELEIRLYVHGPWVCVTERFGVNASLVDTAAGVNLTEREVINRDSGQRDEQGHKIYDRRNYVDYFHSLLHVSPDSRHFLSNGWVWSPVDIVRVFSAEAFLTGYEPTGVPVATAFGYNWDRPCAFVDDRTFVLALDDSVDTSDPEETAAYTYRQLAFFEIPDLPAAGPDRWLEPRSFVACDVFPRNQHGEVKGELHFDAESGCLVALTGDGAFVVSLQGDVVAHAPDLVPASPPSHGDVGSRYSGSGGWSYAPRHRVFYRWSEGAGIEERRWPA